MVERAYCGSLFVSGEERPVKQVRCPVFKKEFMSDDIHVACLHNTFLLIL